LGKRKAYLGMEKFLKFKINESITTYNGVIAFLIRLEVIEKTFQRHKISEHRDRAEQRVDCKFVF
jgi:hypothetical protein